MRIRKVNQTPGVVATVVDNLNSDSAVDALSAKQGKELKQMIDNFEPSSGSSSLDTFPVGTIIKYDGDTIPEGWEQVDYEPVEQIGGANYLLNSKKDVNIVIPSSNYNQYWWTNTHPLALKTSSRECNYTLSFRFVPSGSATVPATSVVVGGVTSGDAWGIRLYFGDNWKIEKYKDYYQYSTTFTILGNNDWYLYDRIGFIAESVTENAGGTVSHIKLEEGTVRTDWSPCMYYNETGTLNFTQEDCYCQVYRRGNVVTIQAWHNLIPTNTNITATSNAATLPEWAIPSRHLVRSDGSYCEGVWGFLVADGEDRKIYFRYKNDTQSSQQLYALITYIVD